VKPTVREEKPTVFFARDVHQINLVLGKFLQKSRAETVLLVDAAGHLVARQGHTSPASEDTITALVAGTFAASQAMAQMLGAREFSSIVPCGDGKCLMLLRAGDHALLAVTFADESSDSLIRTYALDVIRRLEGLYARDGATGSPDEKIERKEFDKGIDGALDGVFG
jgi:predicted regulator of Ras-like GTPase activity (Roadblock/LC7/MglB family)